MNEEMSQDRKDAIRLMELCGWTYKRDGKWHEFEQPAENGWYDVRKVSHPKLSLDWAVENCGHQEIMSRLNTVKFQWADEMLGKANAGRP